ncbi:MAG: glycosyltransferase [Desulfobacterales bacterium]
MGKFLFTNLWSDDLGLPTRTVPLAEALMKMGHSVWFCNPGSSPDRIIREAGFENIVPKLSIGPATLAPWTTEVYNVDQFSAMFGYSDKNYTAHCIEAVAGIISDTGVDVVVDSWNLFSCAAARILKKPLVSVIQADMHPRNRGFIWWRDPPENLPTPVPAFNTVLVKHGINPILSAAELFLGDLTLCTGIPETDPIPPGEDVIYIGPVFYREEATRLPDWIASMDTERPLIWVYSGNPEYLPGTNTWGDSKIVLEAAIDGLAGKDVMVVMTTGYHELPASLPPLPDNFRFEKFIPGLALARRCDLMIHHGGHGSTMTGAYTGTPALIIPTYSERESNARRMAGLGAAELIIPETNEVFERTVSGDELWQKVSQMLADSSYAKNANKIKEKMRTYGGARYGARLISEFFDDLSSE